MEEFLKKISNFYETTDKKWFAIALLSLAFMHKCSQSSDRYKDAKHAKAKVETIIHLSDSLKAVNLLLAEKADSLEREIIVVKAASAEKVSSILKTERERALADNARLRRQLDAKKTEK